jgi:hypothetical protein
METRRVDSQIASLEDDLRNILEYQLLARTDAVYWEINNRPSTNDLADLERVIDATFEEIMNRWRPVQAVFELLDKFRILVQNCAWVAINVPWPGNDHVHCEKVIDNIFDMYVRKVYPLLRTEMVMASHYLEVIQRNWRRCNTDPNHPACRRRLLREFEHCNGSWSTQARSGFTQDPAKECCTPTH